MTAAVRFKHRGLLAAVERAKSEPCGCGCDAQAWRLLQAAAAAADDHEAMGIDQHHARMGLLRPWERFSVVYAREIALACWIGFGLLVWALKP